MATVTALTILVEGLYADDLAETDDPALIGKAIVNSAFTAEKAARDEIGESDYVLQVSDAVTSLIDRAVAKAISQKSKRSQA